MKMSIIILATLLTLGGVGCVAISSLITPAELDTDAVKYVVAAEVAEPNEYVGYPNLAKAEKLQQDVEIAYTVTQFDLQQQAERNELDYNICLGATTQNVKIGKQREEMLFGESGLLTLGLGLAGFGGLTGYIGLMRKRPQDITPQEKEKLLADVQDKTTAELTTKDRQILQLITSAQKFIDTYKTKNPEVVADFKLTCNTEQDTDTQIKVAQVKATI